MARPSFLGRPPDAPTSDESASEHGREESDVNPQAESPEDRSYALVDHLGLLAPLLRGREVALDTETAGPRTPRRR